MGQGSGRSPATTDLDGREVVVRLGHEIVLDVCVRLLRGEVIEVADQSGRNWRATMDSLSLVFRGEPCPVLENADAFEVAVFLLARVAHTSR